MGAPYRSVITARVAVIHALKRQRPIRHQNWAGAFTAWIADTGAVMTPRPFRPPSSRR